MNNNTMDKYLSKPPEEDRDPWAMESESSRKRIRSDIEDSGSIPDTMDLIQSQIAELQNDVVELREGKQSLQREIDLLKRIVSKKDREIDELQRGMVEQKRKALQHNLLLHNVKEETQENLQDTVRQVVSKETQIPFEQLQKLNFYAYRMGGLADARRKKPRIIVIELEHLSDKRKLQNSWIRRKKGADDIKITEHLPLETLHKRQLNFQLVKNAKENAENEKDVHFRFQSDKVLINNQLTRPPVTKVSVQEMFETPEEAEEVRSLTSGKSEVISDRGSMFQAVAYNVSSRKDVQKIYRHIVSSNADADHNILAYRLPKEEAWHDDREWGAGRFLLEGLKRGSVQNIMVVVSRHFGGTLLGSKRFDHIKTVAVQASRKLKNGNQG